MYAALIMQIVLVIWSAGKNVVLKVLSSRSFVLSVSGISYSFLLIGSPDDGRDGKLTLTLSCPTQS